eukprot:1195222-Prorocentrum_minimum.AAC.1
MCGQPSLLGPTGLTLASSRLCQREYHLLWGECSSATKSRRTHRAVSSAGLPCPRTTTSPRATYPGGGTGRQKLLWHGRDPLDRQTCNHKNGPTQGVLQSWLFAHTPPGSPRAAPPPPGRRAPPTGAAAGRSPPRARPRAEPTPPPAPPRATPRCPAGAPPWCPCSTTAGPSPPTAPTCAPPRWASPPADPSRRPDSRDRRARGYAARGRPA